MVPSLKFVAAVIVVAAVFLGHLIVVSSPSRLV
jgi:hypothetical protein